MCSECWRRLPPRLKIAVRRSWDEWQTLGTRTAYDVYATLAAYVAQTAHNQRNPK